MKSAIGNTAEINADVFYTDYKDLQTSAFDGAIGFNVGNGSAKVMGAEVQGRWRVTPSFTLTGSMAYLDFEWTNYYGQCCYGLTPIPAGQPNDPATATTMATPTSWRHKFTGVRRAPTTSGWWEAGCAWASRPM